MSELAVRENQPNMTLMTVVDRLSENPNVDVSKLYQLLEMQERWEANQAKKAFNVAFSEFKAEAVQIVKNITVMDGPLKGKKYADLFGVVNIVIPAMSKHGLSHSWKLTKDDPQWMEVTCTIRHILGHSESVSMGAAPDTGPGRNAIQARGSAKSYLERYTLLAATGMAATDIDDNGAGTADMTESIVADLKAAKTQDSLKEMFGTAYKRAAKRPEAQKAYKEAYETRKAELAKLSSKDGQ